jgi:hypothetical protein
MSKTSTKKISIILLILSLIVIGIWYATYSYITRTTVAITNLEHQYQEENSAEERDQSLKQFFSGIGANTNSLTSRLIAKKATVPFIDSIESLARSTNLGIVMNGIEIKEDPAYPNVTEYLKLNFTTQGSWVTTDAFLAMIENMPYKVKINKVDLQHTASTTASDNWQAVYDIEILKQKES